MDTKELNRFAISSVTALLMFSLSTSCALKPQEGIASPLSTPAAQALGERFFRAVRSQRIEALSTDGVDLKSFDGIISSKYWKTLASVSLRYRGWLEDQRQDPFSSARLATDEVCFATLRSWPHVQHPESIAIVEDAAVSNAGVELYEFVGFQIRESRWSETYLVSGGLRLVRENGEWRIDDIYWKSIPTSVRTRLAKIDRNSSDFAKELETESADPLARLIGR